MRILWLVCLVPCALGLYVGDGEDFYAYNTDWEMWKMEHGKEYGSAEVEQQRRAVWKDNMDVINKHNENENASFTLAMNQFGDLTDEEFKRIYLGVSLRQNRSELRATDTFQPEADIVLPDEVDWRKEGYVTAVKNQGACGSCWAFSTTGSVEGQHFKKTNKLVSLSEQNLVDCSRKEGNHGCNGGLMDLAFTYIKENGGIDTEASYPYTAKDGTCHYVASESGATVSGFTDVKREDESALQQAVATVGPISVAIDAAPRSFRFYKKGVFYDFFCSQTRLDHGVLAVGYGVLDGKDYWLVKNSWGASWGMEGYIMMSRNRHNNCGIATQASYPLV